MGEGRRGGEKECRPNRELGGLVLWAFVLFPGRHPARLGACVSGILVMSEVAVGAGLVYFELVAGNASAARAIAIAVHLVNTFLLLGALTLTAWWHRAGYFPCRGPQV